MKKSRIAIGALSCVVLVSAGGAVYYRGQTVKYEQMWGDAMEQLSETFRKPVPPREPEKTRPYAPAPPPLIDASLAQQIAALEADLEEKEKQIEELTQATKMQAGTNRLARTKDRKQQFDELKKTDPEKYEEMVARREEMRTRMQDSFSKKAITLLDRDTSALSEEELTRYEQMLSNMDTVWSLAEQMTSPDTPPEERREIRQELADTTRELQPMLKEERERRFVELGEASGYSETEAQEFAEYIDSTIQATSLQSFGGRRGGGPRGGGR